MAYTDSTVFTLGISIVLIVFVAVVKFLEWYCGDGV